MSVESIIWIGVIIVLFIIPSLKPSRTPVVKIGIMSAVMAYLLFDTVKGLFHFNEYSIVVIVLSALVGVGVGFYLSRKVNIEIDVEKKTVAMSGSYFTLVLFVIVFAIIFLMHTAIAMSPHYASPGEIQYLLLAALSLVVGVRLGRSVRFMYCYHQEAKNKEITAGG